MKITLLLFFIIIVLRCSDDSINSSNYKLSGQFVVDKLDIKMHQNSLTDSLSYLLTYSLKYHFANQPGTVQSLSVIIQDSISIVLFLDYVAPLKINEEGNFTDSIPLSLLKFDSIDSIKFEINISGVFWDYDFENSEFYGFLNEFKWSKIKWLQLPK